MASSSGIPPSAATSSDVEAGFAKLQGEDFEYYMQTYSIVLGRNSKKSTVDVDLASLGGGMNISRNHARIFYDFPRRRFALDVIGKNGCQVEGVLHLPGNPPVKLDSQDLLQIGDKSFYFLLPTRSILGRRGGSIPVMGMQSMPPRMTGLYGGKKGGVRQLEYDDYEDDDVDEDGEEDDDEEEEVGELWKKRRGGADGYGAGYGHSGPGTSAHFG